MALSLRDEVKARAHGLCEYCAYPDAFSPGPFAVEHIIPEASKVPTRFKTLPGLVMAAMVTKQQPPIQLTTQPESMHHCFIQERNDGVTTSNGAMINWKSWEYLQRAEQRWSDSS